MSTAPLTRNDDVDYASAQSVRRASTETKLSLKTTEFFAFVGMVLAVIITANLVDGDGTNGDPFSATTAMQYVVYLTIGYMVARGLAKSGSHESHSA